MEFFETETVTTSLNDRPVEDRSRMVAELKSANTPQEIAEFQQRWQTSDAEMLALHAAYDIARALGMWSTAEDIDKLTPTEAGVIETQIIELISELPAERASAVVLMLSYFAYKYASTQSENDDKVDESDDDYTD